MAQSVKVVRATLSAALAGTTDFTSAGFGTPTAAIIIVCNGNSTNNPQDNAILSVGFWDGTNQRCIGFQCNDAGGSSTTTRVSNDAFGASFGPAGGHNAYTVSSVTDGIRLTMSTDNTSLGRFCTVILLAGVSAAAGTLTPNATQNNTQASASLGFAPKCVFFLSIGATSADVDASLAQFAFGFARDDGTHRCILWSSDSGAADEAVTVQYSETRCTGQVTGGALTWTGEVTTFGADTFTMTTRDGATGSDLCFYLALGGADLSIDVGTLTTPTSTGNDVVSTDIAPDALLLFLSTASGTTLATDAQGNGLTIGLADDDGQFSHNSFVEDGAATMNTGSVASATTVLDLDSSSGGSRTDVCTATVTLNASDFTLNYSAVDATARKGWWVAFGAAGGATAFPHHYYQQMNAMVG